MRDTPLLPLSAVSYDPRVFAFLMQKMFIAEMHYRRMRSAEFFNPAVHSIERIEPLPVNHQSDDDDEETAAYQTWRRGSGRNARLRPKTTK